MPDPTDIEPDLPDPDGGDEQTRPGRLNGADVSPLIEGAANLGGAAVDAVSSGAEAVGEGLGAAGEALGGIVEGLGSGCSGCSCSVAVIVALCLSAGTAVAVQLLR